MDDESLGTGSVWGVLLGSVLGGPVGAILGGAIAAGVVAALSTTQKDTLLSGIGVILSHVAREQGRESSEYMPIVCAMIDEVRHDLDSDLSDEEFEEIVDDIVDGNVDLELLFKDARANQAFREYLLVLILRLTVSLDPRVSAVPEIVQDRAAALGASIEEIELYASFFVRPILEDDERTDAYRVLGLEPGASLAQLQKRFRELARKYHPDVHSQAASELRELASEHFKRLRNSYNLLVEHSADGLFGWSRNKAELVTAKPSEVMICLYCGKSVRMPPREDYFEYCRCGQCKALLVFDRTTAEMLLEVMSDDESSGCRDLCPQCGFGYGWDSENQACRHCGYS